MRDPAPARRQGLRHLQHAGLRPRAGRGRAGARRDRRSRAPTRSSCRTSASLRMARQIAPDLEIHGSTQMSITSADGVRLAQSLGVSRVTLARELSLAEVRAIREADRLRAGDLRPRRAVRRVLGPVLLVRGVGRPQRQSRAVRAGLPPAVRNDRGRRSCARSPTRATCSRRAIFTRCEQVPEIVDIGISALKIEGPLQGCGLRGADHRAPIARRWTRRGRAAS